MQVGGLRVDPVHDGVARVKPSEAFAAGFGGTGGKGASDADWDEHRDMLDADGNLEMALGGFLVRGGPLGERIVLVDTGFGSLHRGPFIGGELLVSLANLGVHPDDVTDVVFTHLHFDHVGWASADGQPVFKNATIRCDEADWHYFMQQEHDASDRMVARSQRLLGPVANHVEPYSGSGTLLPGIDRIFAPGHTPGSSIIVLSDQGERAMLLGDVVHCPMELLDDEWASLGDVDPALARQTRLALNREMEGDPVPVVGAHFPGLRFGRVLMGEGGKSWAVP